MTKLGSQHLPLELDQQRWHVGASGGTWRSNPEPERQRTAPTGSFHLLPESRSEMGLEFWCDVSDISKSCQMLDQPKWRGTVWRNNTFGILRKLWVVPGTSWHQKAAGKVQPWSSLQRTQTSALCPDVARPPSTGFHGFFAAPFTKFQVRSFCVIPGNIGLKDRIFWLHGQRLIYTIHHQTTGISGFCAVHISLWLANPRVYQFQSNFCRLNSTCFPRFFLVNPFPPSY